MPIYRVLIMVTQRKVHLEKLGRKTILHTFEIPIPKELQERWSKEVTCEEDGAVLAAGRLPGARADLTWSLTCSLPPDVDGDIDG
jgi:hypothetical protein